MQMIDLEDALEELRQDDDLRSQTLFMNLGMGCRIGAELAMELGLMAPICEACAHRIIMVMVLLNSVPLEVTCG